MDHTKKYNQLLQRRLDDYLEQHQQDIKRAVAHHVGLASADEWILADRGRWLHGRFNVCIQVALPSRKEAVMFRCPMAHALGERFYPGTVDEKLSSEAATYMWMQRDCPDVPIPHLYGFAFTDGRCFTHARQISAARRCMRSIWRSICRLVGWSVPSWYVPTVKDLHLDTGYMILEYVPSDVGQMLSTSWSKDRSNGVKRTNLFRELSRILITLGRHQAPRIGSWKFHDDGTISLTNRPLSCNLVIHENMGAQRIIDVHQTYTATEPYVLDLLSSHDQRFLAQQNAATDEVDCIAQIGTAVMLRSISHHFFDSSTRSGPFMVTPTDLHASNILVDKDWNIVCLVDLEWFCAQPVQMHCPPHWLTGRSLDGLKGSHLTEYDKVCNDFLDIMEVMESDHQEANRQLSISQHMRNSRVNGRFWFSNFLLSVDMGYNLFTQHLYRRYSRFERTVSMFEHFTWFSQRNAGALVARKVAEAAEYEKQNNTT